MSFDISNCNEKTLWEYVATHLKREGIDTILVGGAVVSVYTDSLYQSGDLDFVKGSLFTENLEEAMAQIGFQKHGRHFAHPDCNKYFVEFPGSVPLGIGADYSITPDEKEVNGEVIKILSPTDCVKDRLATYIHFKDRDGLDQAILVAERHPVDFKSIKKWCEGEKSLWAFEELMKNLKDK